MSINLRSSGGNSLYPERIEAPWNTITATSNVNLGGNEITNVSVIHTKDISGLDSADIVPLLEGSTITNLSITNLSNVNSGAIADLVAYDILVENDLSVNGVLRSHQLDTLSGRLDTLSGVVDGLGGGGGGGETLAQTLALGNDASGLNIVNVGNLGMVGSFNMALGTRSGTHLTDLPFYATADIGADSGGFQFGHLNGTTGFGFGFNSIYMSGSNPNLSMNLVTKGTGSLFLKPGGTTRTQIDSNGDVYFNNYAIGTLSITSGGKLTSSSDIRAKKNIEYIEVDGLEIVNKIKPARFQYHHEEHDFHTGFIADQLIEAGAGFVVDGKKYEYEIMTEEIPGEKPVIKLNEDGTPMLDYSKPRMKGVEHSGLIAILVKAIQQLNTKVDKLTKLVI